MTLDRAIEEAEKAAQDYQILAFQLLLAAAVLHEKLAAVNAAQVIEKAKESHG